MSDYPHNSSDIVIVGGGVIGSAIAYFLTSDPVFSGRVTVIERDPTYARASTPLSAGGIRQQFSTPENIAIGRFGADFLKQVPELLEVEGDRPDIHFVEGGYLFLASETGRPILERNHATQRAEGVEGTVLLEPAELARRFPWLSLEGIALGCLGVRDEGWFDPFTLLQAFKRKARSLGAVYLKDEVTGIERDAGRITAVTLRKGGRLACGTMVNAAGAQAGRVAALAGIALPVVPKKRFVYVFDCRTPIEPLAPLTIDPSGVYFRPEGKGFIGGVSPPEDRDPDSDDLEVEYDLFEETVWPSLAERVPAFEAIKLTGAWAGHYDYNIVDQNGIVGRHLEIANLVFANGFSGHGLQQSPAVGRAVAELILQGGYRSIDLTRFGYERFARNEPILELNVV
ncbi:NAD(P)/FAD-dependent oxidoreductase [Oceanibaculum indicum]|uniref:Sarcosine oxidase n=1 Tax=Oceanibaculum indicum TaxID=526216 RepID=A0A420WCR4_9PROT|nr:FAD-binding oxidoreductase [Oceanibaculum indicum]RKQ68692.1 sarcosine oxidase [Oceanibaculum indicum]